MAEVPPLWRGSSGPGLRQGFSRGPRKEAEGAPGVARVERDEETPPRGDEARMGRQTPQVRDLDLHAHEGHSRNVADHRPLSERLQEGAEDDGRAFFLPREAQEQVDPVADLAVRGRRDIDQGVDEGEDGGDACEPVADPRNPRQDAGKGGNVGVAGQGEGKDAQGLAGVLREAPRGVQAPSSPGRLSPSTGIGRSPSFSSSMAALPSLGVARSNYRHILCRVKENAQPDVGESTGRRTFRRRAPS